MSDETETVDFDPNSLTLAELCDIEEVTGLNALDAIASKTTPPIKLTAAFIWIVKRRAQPDLTFEDVTKLRIGDVSLEAPES